MMPARVTLVVREPRREPLILTVSPAARAVESVTVKVAGNTVAGDAGAAVTVAGSSSVKLCAAADLTNTARSAASNRMNGTGPNTVWPAVAVSVISRVWRGRG
ncbi:hypothetical protein [Bradyrhizobium elkanii]